MKYNYEYRALTNVEPKEDMKISGRAIVFNSPTKLFEENGIAYYETISERALDNCNMSDVLLKINHDNKGSTLARTRNKSLNLEVREDGLYFDAMLANTQAGKDAYENIRSGLTPDMSFGFLVDKAHFIPETRTRVVDAIKYIRELSVCDIGAYPDAYVEARDFFTAEEQAIKQIEEERARKEAEYEEARKALILRTYF